jgi:hypothetical protein
MSKQLRISDDLERAQLIARIESSVVLLESGCWIWMFSLKNGYGQLSVHDRSTYAHRLAYELYSGPIPDGLQVCHRCDVRPCCSPDHFFLGTQSANVADCIAKGRNVKPPRIAGEAHPKATLTDEQVADVRARRSAGEKQRDVAARYGVSQSTVWRMSHCLVRTP